MIENGQEIIENGTELVEDTMTQIVELGPKSMIYGALGALIGGAGIYLTKTIHGIVKDKINAAKEIQETESENVIAEKSEI